MPYSQYLIDYRAFSFSNIYFYETIECQFYSFIYKSLDGYINRFKYFMLQIAMILVI